MNLTQDLRTGSGKGSNEKEWASFEERGERECFSSMDHNQQYND